ncbi:MAG: hypothetical protein U1E78_12840 [Gammaproteobacteria bacterium]
MDFLKYLIFGLFLVFSNSSVLAISAVERGCSDMVQDPQFAITMNLEELFSRYPRLIDLVDVPLDQDISKEVQGVEGVQAGSTYCQVIRFLYNRLDKQYSIENEHQKKGAIKACALSHNEVTINIERDKNSTLKKIANKCNLNLIN